jgi:hypothetical protein
MKQELAKPIVAVLANDTELLEDAIVRLENHFGPCDFRGRWHSFTQTDYYEDEMGRDLKRCIISFKNLVPAHEAGAFKEWTSGVEKNFIVEGKRSVNIRFARHREFLWTTCCGTIRDGNPSRGRFLIFVTASTTMSC